MADDPTPDQSETFGEVEAFAELLRWSETQPTWQRDALRRIVENGDLGAEDIEALADFCLDPNLPGTVLAVEHVAAETAAVEPIALLGIERPTGINALAVDQELTFASTGLTIIYGDNGAGKSGYVRILKHACRTRDRGGAILHDLEDANRTRQTATIHFSRGAMADRWAWSPEAPGHADLSSVSIFDSRSANIHVEKTNAVAYIPQPMQVLEALAAACDRVKDALEQRGRRLAALTPLALRNATLKSDPAAGSFLASLSHRSNPAQLEVLSTLSDAEKQRQRDFETDLAQDPKVAAARITSERNRLERGVARVQKLLQAGSETAFRTRDALKADWDAKAEAARLASQQLFAASPLPNIGHATWRALWEAARAYSNTAAYPARRFPQRAPATSFVSFANNPWATKHWRGAIRLKAS